MKKLLFALLLMPAAVFADTITCTDLYVETVSVEGDRDDNFVFANHLVITFKDANGNFRECGQEPYAHLLLTHPARSPLLAAALAAQISGRKVDVLVNTNNNYLNLSNQLSAIGIK